MKVHMQPKRLPLCPKPYQTEHQVQELPTSNSYPKKDDLYATCVTLPIQLSFIKEQPNRTVTPNMTRIPISFSYTQPS